MNKTLKRVVRLLIFVFILWSMVFSSQSLGYNLFTSVFETLIWKGDDMAVPDPPDETIYCIQYGNDDRRLFENIAKMQAAGRTIDWERALQLESNPEKSYVSYGRTGCVSNSSVSRDYGKVTLPHFEPRGGGSLPPAMAYIVSDEPIGSWSREKQKAIWNLKGKKDKNGHSLDGGILSGGKNKKFGSSIYDVEAENYADFHADIEKYDGMNPNDHTDIDDVEVEVNQNTKEYIVGPFELSYINGTYGGITFGGISDMTVIGYNADDREVNSSIEIERFILGSGRSISPKYFKPSSDLKVDETVQRYPKSGEEFYIVFKDPNSGVNSASKRVCKISVDVEFKYMTAQGRYIRFDGEYLEVGAKHCDGYDCNYDYVHRHDDDCYVEWTDEEGNDHTKKVCGNYPDNTWIHDCQKETNILHHSLQDLMSADADRKIHRQELELAEELIDITMDLGGHVWEDGAASKESKVDGISNTTGGNDISLPNIKVTLHEANGSTAIVVYTSNPVRTDRNGNYMFQGLDAMRKYYVKFEYNGQIYMPTEYLNTANRQYQSVSEMVSAGQYNTTNWRITSKGTELPYQRKEYDLKFQEIGSYPHNYVSSNSLGKLTKSSDGKYYNSTYSIRELMGYTLGKDGKYKKTEEQLIDGYEYDENGQRTNQYTLASNRHGNDLETWRKLQFIDDCMIAAYSGSPFKNGAVDTYPVYDRFMLNASGRNQIYDGQFYVNLGLWRRQEFDTATRKDAYRTVMKINNKTVMYKYDKRTDDDKYWDIHVRMSDYDAYYNTGYNREVYKTDYEYSSKDLNHPGVDLEIYVTYKITVRNQSQSIMSQIKEVVDYYDKDYIYRDDLSWVTYNGDNKRTTVSDDEYYQAMVAEDTSKIENARPTKAYTESKYGKDTQSDIANTYHAVYVRGLEDKKLATGESAYIYLTFQVGKKDGKVILDDENSPKMNYAETNGYVTYYKYGTVLPNNIKKNSEDIAGLLDMDSNPGNLVQSDISDKDRYERNFEDDTDRAKGLRVFIDEKAVRKADGTVWEDERTVKSGDAIVGDGVRQKDEKTIAGVTVQLVEKTADGKEYIWQETKTDANGKYSFENYIPGDYIIRFYYGNNVGTVKVKDNKDYTTGGQNSVSYNGQDFKSTTYQQGVVQNNYTDEANRYTGYKNVTTQNETGTYGYDIYESDKKENVSDAKDLWSVSHEFDRVYRPSITVNEKKAIKGRQSVIDYSNKDVTNHKAEILASPYYTPSYNGEKYTQTQMDALINELIQNTYMTAETGVIAVEFEYDRQQSDGLKGTENNSSNSSRDYITETNRYNGGYELKNIDLGLTERPKAELEIDKSIANLKVTLANNSVLFDVNKAGDNVIWKEHEEYNLGSKKKNGKYEEYYADKNKHRYSYRNDKNYPVGKSDKGLVQLTMDEELMHGATVEITYKLKVTNASEVDYEGQRFYYLADSSGANQVTTVANQVVDYVANNLQFDSANKSNQKWTVIQNTTLIPAQSADTDANLVNHRLTDKVKTYNKIIQTDGLSKALKPGESFEKALVLTQLISTENTSDDLTYSNIAEITKTSNTVGRRMAYSVVGNQDPTASSASEVDSSLAERIIVLPPFGETHIFYILGAVIAIILIGGITLIIKKVLKK